MPHTPGTNSPPRHIGIIMDGNRRWAKNRMIPATLGHAAGARRVRDVVKACIEEGVPCLSLFAFSTENWRRPVEEVSSLMGLFTTYLQKEVDAMQKNGVRLKVAGDVSRFDARIQALIAKAQTQTAGGTRLTLMVCANYGGRWDVLEATKAWLRAHPDADPQSLTEAELAPHLSSGDAPEVDLVIRTGGEQRISNFMLWQAAYAELYFSPLLWPDFRPAHLQEAIQWFKGRDRRFGSSAPI